MEESAVKVERVKKSFRSFYDRSTSLKEKVLFSSRRRYEWREVLKDISLDVKRGEAVGIIGENGCGKSTLLKLLSRIMYPDSGSIELKGRVSALIELGAGFHPDMSGRENIYTNAAIFGLPRKEIDSRLESIIEFSGLGEFIDNPVRTYSSGMYMRLAFSVAINVDADILLVDEILAVGDAAFQAKGFNKLREIKQRGATIVIVSHALGQIEQFCDRSVWIRDGVIAAQGRPADVHAAYLDYMGRRLAGDRAALESGTPKQDAGENTNTAEETEKEGSEDTFVRWGNGDVKITDVRLINTEGKAESSFRTGEDVTVEFGYDVVKMPDAPVVGIGIFRNDGVQCYGSNTQIEHLSGVRLAERGSIRCTLKNVNLLPGEYFVDLAIHNENGFAYDYFRFARKFTVYSPLGDVGLFRIEHQWEIS